MFKCEPFSTESNKNGPIPVQRVSPVPKPSSSCPARAVYTMTNYLEEWLVRLPKRGPHRELCFGVPTINRAEEQLLQAAQRGTEERSGDRHDVVRRRRALVAQSVVRAKRQPDRYEEGPCFIEPWKPKWVHPPNRSPERSAPIDWAKPWGVPSRARRRSWERCAWNSGTPIKATWIVRDVLARDGLRRS